MYRTRSESNIEGLQNSSVREDQRGSARPLDNQFNHRLVLLVGKSDNSNNSWHGPYSCRSGVSPTRVHRSRTRHLIVPSLALLPRNATIYKHSQIPQQREAPVHRGSIQYVLARKGLPLPLRVLSRRRSAFHQRRVHCPPLACLPATAVLLYKFPSNGAMTSPEY